MRGRIARAALAAARRIASSLAVLLAILVLNFALLHSAEGDIAQVLAGESGAADAAYVEELRRRFGLDRPLPVQLLSYVGQVARLDFGWSFRNDMPVLSLILQRLPATGLLSGGALLLAVAAGILLGALAARRAGGWVDGAISAAATLGYATPLFWIGLMLIVLFAVRLGWLPSGGYEDVAAGHAGLARALDILRHLVLPVTTLALFYTAVTTRIVRVGMIEALASDYVRTARAAGVAEPRVTWRGALRNAVLPLVTVAGLQVASLLGGTVLVETVFAWPGLGRLAYEAIASRDLNLLLGMLLFSSALVLLVNALVDAAYAVLDPRLRGP